LLNWVNILDSTADEQTSCARIQVINYMKLSLAIEVMHSRFDHLNIGIFSNSPANSFSRLRSSLKREDLSLRELRCEFTRCFAIATSYIQNLGAGFARNLK